MNLFDILLEPYALRALAASAMVGVMCGVLGCFIVLRNMSLIGDALSHAILPGVVLGFIVAGYSVLGFFVGSVLAGLLAAIAITWIQQNVRTQEDAAIGIVFTSMFALGVMGISYVTLQEGVHLDLKDFLFGQILGISDQDLWLTGLVLGFTLLSVASLYRFFFATTFESVVARTLGISTQTMHYFLMLLLSFAVVASLQSVGVILVVAMLITPASTAYLLTHRLRVMLILAGGFGLLAAVLGLLVAIQFQTTPGPAMTVVATVMYLLAVLFSPSRGLVSRNLIRYQKRQHILREDVLKRALRLHEQGDLNREALARWLDIRPYRLKKPLRHLKRREFLRTEGDRIELTEKGIRRGYELIRAHRLWETYLVQEVGLTKDQIHEDAERLEHLLPQTLLDEVEAHLGYPESDPHGSPIPARHGNGPNLAQFGVGQKPLLSSRQNDLLLRARLWELGLTPGEPLEILAIDDDSYRLRTGAGKEVALERALAGRIRVANQE